MRKVLFSFFLSGLFVAPAVGSDIYVPPVVPYVGYGFDWNGFYAGVSGGYGTGAVASTGDINAITTTVPLRGALLGITAGHNWQNGQVVFGAEGDIMWSGLSGTTPCATVPAYDCNAGVAWMGSLRARAGLAMDNVLLFATGGLAVAQGRGTITPTFPGTTSLFESTFVGWTLGAGLEVAMSESVSVKAEYAYYDFGSRIAPNGTLNTIQSSTVAPTLHAAKLGINFHF